MSYLELAKNKLAEMQHHRDSSELRCSSQGSRIDPGQLQSQPSIAVTDIAERTNT